MKFTLFPLVVCSVLTLACQAFAGTDHGISRDLAVSPPPAAEKEPRGNGDLYASESNCA